LRSVSQTNFKGEELGYNEVYLKASIFDWIHLTLTMEFRLRKKTTSHGDESPKKKSSKTEKFAIGEKIL
jgi:hypothetical protein